MKKNITIVFLANMINMLFSVVSSFILPKYLSIESYGYYKIFQLYISYLGLAHLGYADGIYLRYGGHEISKIGKEEILDTTATLRNMQIVFMLLVGIISILINNSIMFLISLSFVPINMISYYKNLFQATGEFENYSKILCILPIIIFLCNIVLLFGFKSDNFILFSLIVIIANLILYILLEYKSSKIFGKIKLFTFKAKLLKDNISLGIALTIGNFASLMVTSIDRVFIQNLLPINDFSFYSFAVSVENLFNVCVSAVTTTLYNYLCKIKDDEVIIKIKTYCTFIGIVVVSIAFPVKLIIKMWIPKYSESIICLFALIGAHLFYFVIKAIYVNLYKVQGRQKKYLSQIIIVLIIAVLLNFISFYFIKRIKESFAFASLVTAIIWFVICFVEFKSIRGNKNELVLLIVSTILFLVTGINIENAFLGLAIYSVGVIVISFLLCKKSFIEFINIGLGFLKKIANAFVKGK